MSQNPQTIFNWFKSSYQHLSREKIESYIINRILTTKEVLLLHELILKSVDDSYFIQYGPVYKLIVDHYYQYREIPPADLVEGQFPNYIFTPINDNINPLIDELIIRWEYEESKRIIAQIVEGLQGNSRDKVLQSINGGIEKLSISRTSKPESAFIADAQLRRKNYLETPIENMFPGIKTGIPNIDDTVNGIQSTDFIGILAREWVGKTFFNIYLSYMALLQGKRVIYFSPELSSEQLLRRFDLMHNHFNYVSFRKKQLTEEEINVWEQNNENIIDLMQRTGAELYVIDDIPAQQFSIKMMSSRMKKIENMIKVQEKIRHPDQAEFIDSRLHMFDLMVIDGFHIMKADNPQLAQKEIGGVYRVISNDLKSFCRIEKVPIIISLHANRDGEEGQAVATSKNIALSDGVGRDLDLLLSMFQTKEMRDANIMGISAEKMRDGSPFVCIFKWDPSTCNIEFKKTVKTAEEAITSQI